MHMAPTQWPDAGTWTLLVFDDEADILDAVRRLFRKTYRVLTCHRASRRQARVARSASTSR